VLPSTRLKEAHAHAESTRGQSPHQKIRREIFPHGGLTAEHQRGLISLEASGTFRHESFDAVHQARTLIGVGGVAGKGGADHVHEEEVSSYLRANKLVTPRMADVVRSEQLKQIGVFAMGTK
jgi:hypothetical protein